MSEAAFEKGKISRHILLNYLILFIKNVLVSKEGNG